MKNNLIVNIFAQSIVFIFLAIVINFILFFVIIISISLGGTAEHGYVDNSTYFLGDHGHYTQVSEAIFQYSVIHTKITLALQPLGLIIAPFLIIIGGLRKSGILKNPLNKKDFLIDNRESSPQK